MNGRSITCFLMTVPFAVVACGAASQGDLDQGGWAVPDGGSAEHDNQDSPDAYTIADAASPDAAVPACWPSAEKEDCSNSVDDNCDGLIDSDDPDCQACSPHETNASCATGLMGVCARGTQRCLLQGDGTWAWSACVPNIAPGAPESCGNELDQDCDGLVPSDDPDCYCHNGVQDKDETSIDCGGAHCSPCGVGQACSIDSDCTTGSCESPSFSGGCTTEELASSIYLKDGQFVVDCSRFIPSTWIKVDPSFVTRPITLTGASFSATCPSPFQLPGGKVSYQEGKLHYMCVSINPWVAYDMLYDLEITGASLSGGCQEPLERAYTSVFFEQGQLMLECVSIFDASGTRTQRRPLILVGPKTCQ